jgi:hypothetical protein
MFALGPFQNETGHPQIDMALAAAQSFSDNPRKFQLRWSGLIPAIPRRRELPWSGDMQKTLDRLTAIQTERKTRRQLALEEAAVLYELEQHKRNAEIRHMSRGQALSPEDPDQKREVEVSGFVFSIHQIHAFVTRKRQLKQAARTENRFNNQHHPKHPKAIPALSGAA